jgi:high affinity Mn2+ porin
MHALHYLCALEKPMNRQLTIPHTSCRLLLLLIAAIMPACLFAKDNKDSTSSKRFNLHFQATYVYQYKPEFSAKYSGTNSLKTGEERENSITSTLYLGIRLWKGAEIYINPEVAGGSGLSGAFGLAASSNGETFRVGDPEPTLYIARGYLQQTFSLGHEQADIEDGLNQLMGRVPKKYLRFYLGKLALSDIFDNNAYANSPRTQFLNWCLMNNGAFDYAANVRGYTYTFATVLQLGSMSYKAALATLPVEANGMELNTDLSEEFSINAEVEKSYQLHGKPGNIRLLGYHNNGHMGNYETAINSFRTGPPDVISTRAFGRTKNGICISADQQLSTSAGIFLRAGWNDGQNETWVFTEADRSLSAGVSLIGSAWKRSNDVLGFGIDVNGLSEHHRNYLALGGLGFQLGDGALNYANEAAAELYYSFKPFPQGIWLTADYQFILNPGYNSDRGPVNVFSVRVHAEL